MQKPPISDSEEARLETLKSFEVLDTLPESVFDNITLLASLICKTPIALISLIDEKRQWFKSRQGLDAPETSRDISFCGHAIASDRDIFEVPNALSDDRFADNPLTTGEPRVIFYAGAPLETSNGERIGTLCVIDHEPKNLDESQRVALRALADQVVVLFESRKASLTLIEQKKRERKIETAARRDRDNLQLVFDVSPVGMALVREPEFVFEKVNEAFKRLVTPRVYLGKKWFDVYQEVSNSPFLIAMNQVYNTGVRHAEKEMAIDIPRGLGRTERRHFDVTYDRIDMAASTNYAILIQIVDVTDSMQARADLIAKNNLLAETQRLLAAATKVAKVGFFEWKIPENIIYFSEQMQTDWGINAGVPIDAVLQYIHEDDRLEVEEKIRTAIENRLAFRAQYRIHPPDQKSIVWIEAQGEVTYDENGRALTFLGTSINITARKYAEREVQDIANSIPQLAWTADSTGSCNWYNQRWYDYTGTTEEQMRGWGWTAVQHPDHEARVVQKVAHCFSTGTDWEDIFPLRGKDGNYRWFLSRAVPIRDDDGNILRWFGSNTDVTEQREAEDAAEKANSAKSVFLANMSHEIRSPLGAIMGFSDLMKAPDLTKAEISNFVSVIDRNSNHVLRIIDDILDLSKVEAGKMLIEHLEFSLPDLLGDFTSLMGLKARDKGIGFELRIPTPIPEKIISDPTRIRQILNNVVGNALKFTEQGRVQMIATYNDHMLTFKVQDTGTGITREQAERLFQAFQQADVSTTRKFGGTGLGLVLTRRIAETMGGDFQLAASEVGQGSTFVASVRVDLLPETKMVNSAVLEFATSPPKAIETSRPLANLRLLVIEDSPDNQALFRLILTKLGASIEIGKDGFEGVDLALASDYDVVLCDVQMPRMDGYEATRELRSRGYNKPIIALTAHAMKEERDRALAAGFTDFLSKPIQKENLIETVLKHSLKS